MNKSSYFWLVIVTFGWAGSGFCGALPPLHFDWLPSHDTHFSQKTKDGGYVLSGQFWTPGGNQYDFWVLKLDRDGNIEWQKTYGGSDWDIAFSTEQTAEGGYIVSGTTSSFGAGEDDVWIIKLDAGGNVVWQKTYGGKAEDRAGDIEQTKDGGYIVTGTTSSFGDGEYDIWVLRLDPNGGVLWNKTYGGKAEESDFFRHIPIEATSDGGYILAGSTKSFGAGADDFWILRLDPVGNIVWQKTFGTSEEEYPTSVVEMENGTFRLTGTESLGADGDDWILILDPYGNIVGVNSKKNKALTLFDTSVVPKSTTEKTSDTAASINDTTVHMERKAKEEITVEKQEQETMQ